MILFQIALALILSVMGPTWAHADCLELLNNVSDAQNPVTLQRFAVVTDDARFQILRGSAPRTEADMQFLKSQGVDTIVTLEIIPEHVEEEEALAARYGIRVVRAPIDGSTLPPSEASVNRALGYLRDKSLGKIYVHCKLGRDRTSMIVALHRIYDEGVSVEAARAEAEQFGFIPQGIHRLTLWGLYHYFNTHATLPETNPN